MVEEAKGDRATACTDADSVSIGITCFNARDTIGRAVHSALGQTRPAHEILVVDDGSEDDSPRVVEEIARKNARVRLLRHERNMGYPTALNTLLSRAEGAFLAVFDDDDESAPERIEIQLERLLAYERRVGKGNVICYGNRKVVRPDGRICNVMGIGRSSPEPHGEVVAEAILCLLKPSRYTWGEFGSCTLLARTRTLRDIGGFDGSLRRMAEWDLAIRLAMRGGHFISVDSPVITQYVTQTADKAGRLPLQYALHLRRKYRAYLKGKGLYGLSILMAHARFHYARDHRIRCRALAAVAGLVYPRTYGQQLLINKIHRLRAKG